MPTATRDTTYTYDQNGRLLTETTGGLVTSYEYNNAGLLTQKTLDNLAHGTLPNGLSVYDFLFKPYRSAPFPNEARARLEKIFNNNSFTPPSGGTKS